MIFKRKTKQEMPLLKGRKTMPTRRLIDKHAPAEYSRSWNTDLAATFKAARERMGVAG